MKKNSTGQKPKNIAVREAVAVNEWPDVIGGAQ